MYLYIFKPLHLQSICSCTEMVLVFGLKHKNVYTWHFFIILYIFETLIYCKNGFVSSHNFLYFYFEGKQKCVCVLVFIFAGTSIWINWNEGVSDE